MLTKFITCLSIAFILLPIGFYLAYCTYFSHSVFLADDFHLLKTVLWVQEEPLVFEKIKLFLRQHNEHRIVIPRLATYISYLLSGHINWRFLIFLGNALWVSILWYLWKGFRSLSISRWLFIPVPFVFANPQYYENVSWAISILQQSVVVFWFVLLSYLCAKRRYKFALMVCIAATFTHGNGIFSFFICIASLAFDREWRRAVYFILCWLLTGIIYFYDFSQGQNADFLGSLSNPIRLIASFFGFFGSISKVKFTNTNASVLTGVTFYAFVVAFIYFKVIQLRQEKQMLSWFHRMLALIMLFLLITGGLVSISRSWGGIETVLAPRYQHYSSFMACIVYLLIISGINVRYQAAVGSIAIMVCITFNFMSYSTYTDEVIYRKDWLIADDANWQRHHKFLNYSASFNHNIGSDYERAVSKGICVSDDYFVKLKPDTIMSSEMDLKCNFSVRTEVDASRAYSRNYISIHSEQIVGDHIFLFLASNEDRSGYWLPTRKEHHRFEDFFKSGYWFKQGFTLDFLTENIPAGTYNVGILKDNRFIWTEKKIKFETPSPSN